MSFLLPAASRKSNEGNTWATFRDFFQLLGQTKSGQAVTWQTALQVSTVFACARLVANGLAQVPLKVFLDADDGKKLPAKDHPLYWPLYRKPNPWQTSFQWRQTVGLHLMLCGEHFSFKNVVRGQVVELIPFQPNQVAVRLSSDGYERLYDVILPDGKRDTLTSDQVWHVSGASWCGWHALEPVKLAREAIGLSLAIEGEHARLFKNGIRTAGTYSVEGTLDEEGYTQLREFLAANFSGENQGLPMIVDRGAQWLPQALSGVDAQTLETRRFQVQEVCRAMGVMPLLVGLDDKSNTFAGAEQMLLAHEIHTMGPWYQCLEEAMDVGLIGEDQVRRGYYAKFVVQALRRVSMKDRGDYFAKALGSGGHRPWMTQDEVRALDEMNPMGGDAALLLGPTASSPPQPAGGTDDNNPAPQGA